MFEFLKEWLETGETLARFTVMVTLTDQKGSPRRTELVPTTPTTIVPTKPELIPIGSRIRETGLLDKDRTIRFPDGLKR